MPVKATKKKAKPTNKTRRPSSTRGGKPAVSVNQFVHQYYEHVPPHDIAEVSAADLHAAAAAHLAFAAKRTPGRAGVRVYNPKRKKHGWDCPHTVVEIVTDDMPFLVDSITAALNQLELIVHLVIHPIIKVRRGAKSAWVEPVDSDTEADDVFDESFMHFEVTEQPEDRLENIRVALEKVLKDVRAAVNDWQAMRDRLGSIVEEMNMPPAGVSAQETDETRDFLRWAHDDHFTFLGYRDYDFVGVGSGAAKVSIKPREGMGVLRGAKAQVFNELSKHEAMSPEVRAFIRRPDLLLVTKSSFLSAVHRPVHMDAIGVKRLDDKGRAVGQRLFVGLFTSSAYNRSPRDIPLLRRKLRKTFERAGFPRTSHNAKALLNILETYPRDELFQVSDDELYRITLGVLHLQERQRLALFIRSDDFERFMSCLIYIPRDRYTTVLRQRLQVILEEVFAGGVTAHYIQLGDAPLARLHVLVRTTPGAVPPYDTNALEARLVDAAYTWADRLQDTLARAFGEERGLKLHHRYRGAFSTDYQEHFEAADAIADIAKLEQTLETGALGMNLYRPAGTPPNRVRFKIYHPERSIPLSDILPMLEHMGLRVVDELPHVVHLDDAPFTQIMIHDFGLETRDGSDVALAAVQANFEDTFSRVWRGQMDSDGFNGLVLQAGLAWREVVILRAFCKYLRQAGITFSQVYMEQTLANNSALARLIIDLFLTTFDPAMQSQGGKDSQHRATQIRKKFMDGLDQVSSADEDRILRRFINVVDSILRTNFFQQTEDGEPKAYLSFKLDSRNIDELPLPRPLREIFVYSPRVEGIHLRFGMVARGGLRWSDRPEDFRTEILGLVKAQQVKNAVIVPVGSKGGFVVKRPPVGGDREAFLNEGIACYKTLISGLLDLTDNLKGSKTIPPPRVVRRDDDDPYLVVAADKGTATFSDIANGVSLNYGFWLGDAFASGGSVGYDHKKMGITARGAWESVKRHFREIGVDTQKEAFTVVGVGDMSGDVFGNGMLLSRHIELVAAFNHLHIFLDPNPDPAKSFAERQRLFNLPRSGWDDYKNALISKGGGIFARTAKSIPLSPEVKKRFGLTQNALSPNELIRTLLAAEVGLLWFGGIGTYLKASTESHGDAGDRANDATRINGSEVRAQVIGEGANLGVTQRARIEYALGGGRLNADSIDNSAGVDCSDHEVNIKILVDAAIIQGKLSSKRRNALLAEMTDEVGVLCLADNYLQTQAISATQSLGAAALDDHTRLMRMLERADLLNRAVEFLPDDETLGERAQANQGLSRPEIAVLLSYSKNWLYAELLATTFPDDPHLAADLVSYFPTALGNAHRAMIYNHRLRREIIATVVTNNLVNRAGETFVTRFMEKTGMAPQDIVRAFTITAQVFALDELWQGIENLDNKVPAAVQTAMLREIDHLVDWVTLWFLRNGQDRLDLGTNVARFKDGIQALAHSLDKVMPTHYVADLRTRAHPYIDQGVPEALALRIAGLVNIASGCDIVNLTIRRKLPVSQVAKLYFAVGSRFGLGRLRAAADGLESETHWQRLAVAAQIEEIYGHQLALAGLVLDFNDAKVPSDKAITAWLDKHAAAVEQTDRLLGELGAATVTDVSMVAVASRQLRALTQAAAS